MTDRFTRYELRQVFDVYASAAMNEHRFIAKYTKRGLSLLTGYFHEAAIWSFRLAIDECIKDHDAIGASAVHQNFCIQSMEILCNTIDKLEVINAQQGTT